VVLESTCGVMGNTGGTESGTATRFGPAVLITSVRTAPSGGTPSETSTGESVLRDDATTNAGNGAGADAGTGMTLVLIVEA